MIFNMPMSDEARANLKVGDWVAATDVFGVPIEGEILSGPREYAGVKGLWVEIGYGAVNQLIPLARVLRLLGKDTPR
jgi:hypothetical protein